MWSGAWTAVTLAACTQWNSAVLAQSDGSPIDASGSVTSGIWTAAWTLDEGELPDGDNFTVRVRATDIGGHVTETSATVTVDIMPPASVTMTATSGGAPVPTGGTIDPAAGLTLTWSPAHGRQRRVRL